MRISIGYPDRAAERLLLAGSDRRDMVDALLPLLSQEELAELQRQVLAVHAAEPLLNYVQDLIAATRSGRWFLQGLSPRAGIALMRAAKAQALIAGRDYVAPDDVQAVLPQTIATDSSPWAMPDVARPSRCAPWPGRAPALNGVDVPARSARPALPAPMAPLRRRWQRWWQSRLPRSDTVELTQRNVYILPTGAGWMLAATLLVLLVASINFQLNLGYLLTFLLAGSAVAGMHVGHGTLRGLSLHLSAPEPQFLGSSATLEVRLSSTRAAPRHGIALALHGSRQWVWADVPGAGSATVQVAFQPGRRGLHDVPALTAETRFPLGAFRVWTIWRPAAQLLVYPQPELPPPPLPAGAPSAGGAGSAPARASANSTACGPTGAAIR